MIIAHRNLISNRLTYLVHAKSTSELISFVFSDHSVQTPVSANHWSMSKAKLQTELSLSHNENDFTFWLIFKLSLLNLGLCNRLNKRLSQQVKWSNTCHQQQQKGQRYIQHNQKHIAKYANQKLTVRLIYEFFSLLISSNVSSASLIETPWFLLLQW